MLSFELANDSSLTFFSILLFSNAEQIRPILVAMNDLFRHGYGHHLLIILDPWKVHQIAFVLNQL